MRLTAAVFALAILPAMAMAGTACAGETLAPARPQPDAQVEGLARAFGLSAPQPSQAKLSRAKSAPETSGAVAAQAQAAPFNPRWVAPKTRIKGLLVFVFTPGHFQRD